MNLSPVAVLLALALCPLPSIVAYIRDHHALRTVVALNVLLVGWLPLLLWACLGDQRARKACPACLVRALDAAVSCEGCGHRFAVPTFVQPPGTSAAERAPVPDYADALFAAAANKR